MCLGNGDNHSELTSRYTVPLGRALHAVKPRPHADYKRKLHYFDLLWICCTDESDRRLAALGVDHNLQVATPSTASSRPWLVGMTCEL